LYYHWWAHNVPRHSRVERNIGITKKRGFPQAIIQHRLTYIPTTYTENQDVTLQWKEFEEFYVSYRTMGHGLNMFNKQSLP